MLYLKCMLCITKNIFPLKTKVTQAYPVRLLSLLLLFLCLFVFQESKLNLVWDLQKLLQVDGRKDIVRHKQYTWLISCLYHCVVNVTQCIIFSGFFFLFFLFICFPPFFLFFFFFFSSLFFLFILIIGWLYVYCLFVCCLFQLIIFSCAHFMVLRLSLDTF